MSWRGSVDADDAGESTVTAAAGVDRWPVIAVFLAIPIWTGYYLTKGERVADLLPVLGAFLVFTLVLLALSRRSLSKVVARQAPLCRAVLLRATQATSAS